MKYTIRREKFVAEYLVSGNGAQAATAAGYSPRSARQQASRLLTKASISIAIEQKRAEARRISGVSVPAAVVRGLLEAVEQAKLRADARAQIQAWTEIAKILGFYPQKKKSKSEIDPEDVKTWPDEMLAKLR